MLDSEYADGRRAIPVIMGLFGARDDAVMTP